MNTVTFWIAVVGFILSVYNFIEGIIRSSRRLSVSVKHIFRSENTTILLIEFTNRSQLGISVTSGILIDHQKNRFVFGETSQEIFRYSYPERKGKESERTAIFPISIDPLRSERVLLQTEHALPGFSRSYRMKLGSSRGRISKTVDLPTGHEDFVSLLSHLK